MMSLFIMFLIFPLLIVSENINGIFAKHFNEKIIEIEASGNSKQDINGSRQFTKPEYSIYPFDKKYDWCSNVGHSYDVHPWISYSLKGKMMKFNGYFVRCGCCYEGCCCEDDEYGCFYCCLYSWSLQISNDNKTWTNVHKIEKDDSMKYCNQKTYKLDKEYTAKYVRLIQDMPCPGYPPCIAINRFELYGSSVGDDSNTDDFISFHDDDDDVSIIGHISKNAKIE